MINLKKVREVVGLNQEEMGEVLHLSREMISKMETGKFVMQPRTLSMLMSFLRDHDYILLEDGTIEKISVSPGSDSDKVKELQGQLIQQQTIRIKNLENLVADKLLLLEAYQKVMMVEFANFEAAVLQKDHNIVSRQLVERLQAEMEGIRKDTVRFYSLGS